MNQLVYWIWLSLSCTPGSDTFKKLIFKFETARQIYEARDYEISSCVGSKNKDYTLLIDKDTKRAEEILDFCTRKNVGILIYADEHFPKSLREIPTPPVLLYYRGVLPDFDKETLISLVGTRRISDYGRRNAFSVSRDLGQSGALIVSGMAIGIDGIALAAALSVSRPTVAVLGSGIDVCYPIQHRTLAREIVKTGCVFTEYAPGTPPDGYNFPIRNRIISGLSEATVVIEGRERSGAILTARHAKEQGRIVYALPGNVGNPNSEVTNLLLKNGARPFTSADDIIRDFENRLNPFKLLQPMPTEMYEVLKRYEIAAVAQGDAIFNVPKPNKRKKAESVTPLTEQTQRIAVTENTGKIESDVLTFDKKSLKVYKKIPADKECLIESLVDSDISFREVMKLLLKLEIARFVVLLPGEKVKRNLSVK